MPGHPPRAQQERGIRIAGGRRLLMALMFLPFPLLSCPIPVYQYALEHWAEDPYELVVHRAGELTEDQQAALDLLQAGERGAGSVVNLRLRIVEAAPGDSALPGTRLEVFYPQIAGKRQPVWSGPLSLEDVRALLNSPVRERLGKALLRRTSAVWVLLESGDRKADDQIEKELRSLLEHIEKTTEVPESALWGGQDVTIDHDVNFKFLRLRREDPAERFFVRMLLASEADLESDFADQPIVFPIYGRGLILYALVGRGINGWTVREAANFLTGPCSCQIKAANPGTDLLMSVDWGAGIVPLSPATVGGATGTGRFLMHLDETEQDGDAP